MAFMLYLTQQIKMTKENRENLYKHLRNLQNTYEALPHLNKGPTATQKVRARAKQSADDILKKHPELEKPLEEVKPKKEKSKNAKE